MILNETYDGLISRLDRYSLNEGFFSDRKKKKEDMKKKREEEYNKKLAERCKALKKSYDQWIKKPWTLTKGEEDILVLAKWYNLDLNKFKAKIKSSIKLTNIQKIGLSGYYIFLDYEDDISGIILSSSNKYYSIDENNNYANWSLNDIEYGLSLGIDKETFIELISN